MYTVALHQNRELWSGFYQIHLGFVGHELSESSPLVLISFGIFREVREGSGIALDALLHP